MANWHFDCALVPKKWLDHDVGRHLIHRAGEKPNFEAAWRTRTDEFSIIEFCDSRFTRIAPSDNHDRLQMLRWDCENGNEIQVAIGHGAVTGVVAQIDTRQAYGDFSTALLELSVLTGCLLHFSDSGRIVEPVMETLVAAIGGSDAARCARDPGIEEPGDLTAEQADADVNNDESGLNSADESTVHKPAQYANLT